MHQCSASVHQCIRAMDQLSTSVQCFSTSVHQSSASVEYISTVLQYISASEHHLKGVQSIFRCSKSIRELSSLEPGETGKTLGEDNWIVNYKDFIEGFVSSCISVVRWPWLSPFRQESVEPSWNLHFKIVLLVKRGCTWLVQWIPNVLSFAL